MLGKLEALNTSTANKNKNRMISEFKEGPNKHLNKIKENKISTSMDSKKMQLMI
jgi:hypothetical protein